MKCRLVAVVLPILTVLAGTAGAAEIQGKVVQIDGDTVSVSVEGKLEPEVGARVKIYHLIPGLDEPASVATGEVVGVKDSVVSVKVLTKTSTVRKGHRATILAERPRKSGEGEPKPPRDPLDLTGEWKITFTAKTAFGSAFTDTGKFRLEKTAPDNFMIPGGNSRARVRFVEKELWFYNEAGGKGTTAPVEVDPKSGVIQRIEWIDGSVFTRVADGAKEPLAKDLDPNLIEAWTKAGASMVWYARGPLGWEFSGTTRPRDVPALPVFVWREQRLESIVIARLPAPATAFGVEANDKNGVTDNVLKKLAGLRNLRLLQFGGRGFTSEGLNNLAGLKDLQHLGLDYSDLTDEELKRLAGLERLQYLSLYATKVTDAGLKELVHFKDLRFLKLGDGVTDAGLKELAALESLKGLSLITPKVTDSGLKELTRLKGLQHLSLSITRVTDKGMKELVALKNLQHLDLSWTGVTGAGLKELAGLKNLQILNLASTKVPGAGLFELAALDGLQYLSLSGADVTDAGLEAVTELKKLQYLDLRGATVTGAWLEALRKALPRCKIVPEPKNEK